MPPGQPNAATITVREALQLLDAQFADFAAGVNEGEYALWLGSGISRGRVVGLNGVLRKIIEFLRTRIATVDVNCAFRLALDHVLTHAVLSEDEQARVNYDVDSAQWPDIETILERLAERYSRVLDVSVTGQAADYLLWVAADFCQTFANQEPDAEHLCIVIMVVSRPCTGFRKLGWFARGRSKRTRSRTGDFQSLRDGRGFSWPVGCSTAS